METKFAATTAALLCLMTTGGALAQTGATPSQVGEANTLMNWHSQPDAAITPDALKNVGIAWRHATPNPVSHTPLVADGRVYFADWGGTVYALDAETGKPVWQKTVEQPKTMWPWHGFAGTGTLGGGLLFEASVEGNAFALDPATGNVVWQTRIAEDPEAGSLARLTYFDGMVFVGLQSVEEPMTHMKPGFKPDFQGKVMALDARTGQKVWETALVQPPHSGVAVWSSFALDPETGVLYSTTGNNYTGEPTEMSDSLVAADARTGKILWHRQATQNDVWTMADQRGPDYDFAGGPQLFDVETGGRTLHLVGAGQKSGYFHVWDRRTGDKLWASSVGYGGVDGGMHGEASLGNDRIIAWANNNYIHKMPPGNINVSIKALNPETGEYLWVRDGAQPAVLFAAGVLAGDIYFLPSLDGKVRAYSAKDGKTLWTSEAVGPITTTPAFDGTRLYTVAGSPGIFGDWAKGGENGIYAFGPIAPASGSSR
ncbi:MAG TPA: PQQ-binding-like beta-propeller repeat protein [Azospirillum sp.]|nr:PQQ-binding-like beta-propeller repeat protein [Azospirillum sp.]